MAILGLLHVQLANGVVPLALTDLYVLGLIAKTKQPVTEYHGFKPQLTNVCIYFKHNYI